MTTNRETTLTDPKVNDLFDIRHSDVGNEKTWIIRHIQQVSEMTEYPNAMKHYESQNIIAVLEISKPNGKVRYAANIHEGGKVYSFEIVRCPGTYR